MIDHTIARRSFAATDAAWCAGALALWFGLGALSVEASVPVVFAAGLLLLRWHRFHTSLLLGVALAWLLMPLSVVDLRTAGAVPRPSGLPGCEILALAGFPIPGLGAHGGGGWRLLHHTVGDGLAHAANGALLAIAVWFALARVPAHRWPLVRLAAWLLFLPACATGLFLMTPWWD